MVIVFEFLVLPTSRNYIRIYISAKNSCWLESFAETRCRWSACISGTFYLRIFTFISMDIFLRDMRYAICEPLLGKDACALGATHGKYQGHDTLLISMDVYDVRDRHKRCNRHAPLRLSLPLRYTQHTFVYGSRAYSFRIENPNRQNTCLTGRPKGRPRLKL